MKALYFEKHGELDVIQYRGCRARWSNRHCRKHQRSAN
jgi:hypothetical protein